MTKVYVVDHIHEYYCDPKDPAKKYFDLKGIGNFYSLKKAEEAVETCKLLKGFKTSPDGFRITEFTLNSIFNQQINLLLRNTSKEKKLGRVFSLYYVLEDEEGDEDIILLGVFTSKKNAINARKLLLSNILLKDLSPNLQIFGESVNKINWETGFITWEEAIKSISKD